MERKWHWFSKGKEMEPPKLNRVALLLKLPDLKRAGVTYVGDHISKKSNAGLFTFSGLIQVFWIPYALLWTNSGSPIREVSLLWVYQQWSVPNITCNGVLSKLKKREPHRIGNLPNCLKLLRAWVSRKSPSSLWWSPIKCSPCPMTSESTSPTPLWVFKGLQELKNH